MTDELLRLLPAALIGLVPLIAAAILKHLEQKSRVNSILKRNEILKSRIELLALIHKEESKLSDGDAFEESKGRLLEELNKLKGSVYAGSVGEEVTQFDIEQDQTSFRRNVVQRMFLAYRPPSLVGWLLHPCCYVVLALVLLVSVSLSFAGDPPSDKINFWTVAPFLAGLYAVFWLPSLLVDLQAERRIIAANSTKGDAQ